MKKRSKLFLLVAGIIFAVGMIVCFVGAGISASEGTQLYAAKIGEDRGYTYDFGDGKTDKIKISVTDADVNIYGASESSYIEVINFNENLCNYSGNNAIITFRETAEIEDITGAWENGLSFKGLRYILRPVSGDKPKTVNIYLEKSEHVKAFDIELAKGNVTISDIDTESDYDVTIESGKITVRNVSTRSSLKIAASGDVSTDISFENVSSDIVEITAKRAKFSAESFSSAACSINVTTGSVSFDFAPFYDRYTVDIATKGKLTVDGSVYPDIYKYPPKDAPTDTTPSDEEEESSYLVIKGSDLSVELDTPELEGNEQEENTEK